MWNGVYVWVKSLDYSPLETDWKTTLLGHKVELEWRLKVPKYFWSFVLNFTASRYAILFLNSEIYMVHINHEWNRSMFVASIVCFAWDIKPDFPTPKSFKLLLQRGSTEPISFLTYWILLLNHSIYQYEIGLFLTTSQNTKQPSHRYEYGEKRFW